jgi:hypothetical protein
MYEFSQSGLGWETVYETNWYGGQTETPKSCLELQHRGVPGAEAQVRCFKETAAEQRLAIESECERIGWECETGDEQGSTWCCAPGRPDHQVPEGEVIPGEPEVTVVPPAGGDPRPLYQHSFMSRLSHPGAIAAISLMAVVGYLGYRAFAANEYKELANV